MLQLLNINFTLSEEWMSAVAGAAVTFVVFIMGVPALISQTFIPDPLRSLYRRRLDGRWTIIFLIQAIILLFLLVFANLGIAENFKGEQEWIWATAFFFFATIVLLSGTVQLIQNFKSTQNLGEKLSGNIVESAKAHYAQAMEIRKNDIDDLSLLAKELPAGTVKHDFLEQCEVLVEHLLDATGTKDTDSIGQILEKVVCPSANTDDTKATEENILKVLDILILTYHKIHKLPTESDPYLIQKIGGYIKEIGIKAIQCGDISTFMYATGKLSQIEGASKEMYALGDAALSKGYMPEAVAMVRNLSSRVRQKSSADDLPFHKDKRSFSWLGLIARIYQKGGWARNFAERQMINLLKPLETQPDFLKSLFTDAQVHFYRTADFSTADAILELQQTRYPNLP